MDLQELTKMYDFTNRTIIVTGGTGVLGSEMVRALVGCNATVAVLARTPAKGQGLLDSLGPRAEQVELVSGDVMDTDSLQRAAETIINKYGRIDGLINAAGGNQPGATTSAERSFFDLSREAMEAVFNLNLMGSVLPTQVFGRQMARQGEGVILNISSMSAIRPLTRVMAYGAAKAGIDSFTQWLAVHMAQEYSPAIRVNAIAPGFFVTEQNRNLLVDQKTGELTQRGQSIIAHTPMGRFGEPEDLIGATLWLLSPASSFVTGIVVPIDGGFAAFGGV
jgi:NAD(P)-dependent dehydrogenase (short-subunit alcohol dehydrogenase family)